MTPGLGVVAALVVGVIAGWVLGGIAPRREVAAEQERVAELQERLADSNGTGWRSPVPGLDQILRAPPEEEFAVVEGSGAETSANSAAYAAPDGSLGGADAGAPDARAGAWREQWRDRAATRNPVQELEDFRRLASIQNVRRVQSRAALAQQADLDEAELESLDAVFDELNEALIGHGEELIVVALSDEPPAPRDLLGITHDVTGILHRAQVQLENIVGPERLGDVEPSALEIWNYVDLRRLEPAALAAIERAAGGR